MNEVNRTLYIPLYGKSYVSRKGIILHDPKAETIWAKEGFPLRGKSKSKWLAYYMGMRASVFDQWLQGELERHPDAIVLHIGCGMDSRCERVQGKVSAWYDIDFPEVIAERRRYYTESDAYHMLPADAQTTEWIADLPSGHAIVVMEGVSMYLQEHALMNLLRALSAHFISVSLLMDCYTTFAAKATKYKNPINEVGVTTVYGVDDPHVYEDQTGFVFAREHSMTPPERIAELRGMERWTFSKLFAGKFAKKIYRLYEYRTA